MTILQTSGIYYPIEEIWMGEKGKVEWRDKGQQEAYTSFKKYSIRTKNMNYVADNATLHYPSVADPIAGKVMDRTTAETVTCYILNSNLHQGYSNERY